MKKLLNSYQLMKKTLKWKKANKEKMKAKKRTI
jgi:hypothetical protein